MALLREQCIGNKIPKTKFQDLCWHIKRTIFSKVVFFVKNIDSALFSVIIIFNLSSSIIWILARKIALAPTSKSPTARLQPIWPTLPLKHSHHMHYDIITKSNIIIHKYEHLSNPITFYTQFHKKNTALCQTIRQWVCILRKVLSKPGRVTVGVRIGCKTVS